VTLGEKENSGKERIKFPREPLVTQQKIDKEEKRPREQTNLFSKVWGFEMRTG